MKIWNQTRIIDIKKRWTDYSIPLTWTVRDDVASLLFVCLSSFSACKWRKVTNQIQRRLVRCQPVSQIKRILGRRVQWARLWTQRISTSGPSNVQIFLHFTSKFFLPLSLFSCNGLNKIVIRNIENIVFYSLDTWWYIWLLFTTWFHSLCLGCIQSHRLDVFQSMWLDLKPSRVFVTGPTYIPESLWLPLFYARVCVTLMFLTHFRTHYSYISPWSMWLDSFIYLFFRPESYWASF